MESGEREKGQAPDPVSSLQSGVLVWVSWMLTLKQGIEGYAHLGDAGNSGKEVK